MTPPIFDPETTTVHDVVRTTSGALEVFGRHGIDTCCGGELPVAEAARRHGVEVDALLAELEGDGAGEAGDSSA